MRSLHVRRSLCVSVCLALSLATPVLAQSNPPPPAGDPPPNSDNTDNTVTGKERAQAKTLGLVTVTAEKKETDLQKTPVTVSTIDGETMTQQGISTVTQAAVLMPGVELQNANSGPSFYIRGIGTKVAAFGSPSPIATYIDGVYQAEPPVIAGSMLDVSRVEVLRGPQGTIYGRNATGGAVNIVTNDPQLNELSDTLTVGLGNYNSVQAANVLNLPLSDWAALRVAVDKDRHSGYLTNGLDDADQTNGRVKLLLQPSDNLRIVLSAAEYHQDNLGTGNVTIPLDGRGAWTAEPYNTADPSCSPNCQPYNHMTDKEYTGQVDWDFGPAKLTYIINHQDYLYTYQQQFSGLWEYKTSPRSQDSDELRLSSTGDGWFHWMTGLYYFDANTGGGIDHIYTFDSVQTTNVATDRSKAAFGQLTFDLADTVHLTTGLRYTHDAVRQWGYLGTSEEPEPASGLNGDAANFHYWSYKVGLDWTYTPGGMLYTDYSTASSEGGSNPYTGPYAPEHIRSFEIGSKNRWLDDRLQLNAAAYYYWYTDYQLSYPHYLSDGDINVYTTDVSGTTTVAGAEAELDYLFTTTDRLGGWLNYNHTSFGEASITENCPVGPPTCLVNINLEGEPLPQAPKRSASLSYEHYFNFGDGSNLTAHFDGKYKSGSFIDIYHFEGSYAAGATVWNARLTYYSADNKWSLGAYINNISNKALLQQSNPAGPAFKAMFGDPRTYGVVFNIKLL